MQNSKSLDLEKLIAKLTMEINKRKQVEKELKQANQKVSTILESITDIFYTLDNQKRFNYVNKEAEEYIGKPKEELIGKHIWDVLPKAFNGAVHKWLTNGCLGGAKLFEEVSVINGKWYEYRFYPSKDGLSVCLKDISVRKHTQEQLLAQAEQMRKQTELLDLTKDSVLVCDLEGKITFWNKGAEKGCGWSKEEAVGKNYRELFKTQFPNTLEVIEKELLENGHWQGELIKTRKDGQQIILDSRWTLLQDEEGKPKSIMEINTDMTEKKAIEQVLRQTDRRFQAVFYSMFSFMSLLKPDGSSIVTNQALLDFVGAEAAQIENNLFWEAKWWNISAESKAKIKEAVRDAANGKVVHFETEIIKANGSIATIDLSLKPLINEEGMVELIISEGHDITERKNFEREMLRLDRLNVVGQAAAGISHEIRNPLTTVRGFLQLLGGREGHSENKKYFEVMIEELDRANAIITKFLSLAKDKAVKKEVSNINTIIKAINPFLVADTVKIEKRIYFEYGEIPDLLLNEKEIRQLIINLIYNGLEAMSPGGKLFIKTYTEDEAVVLAVQDQGTGIEPSILDKLGTPFLTTKDYGTGLGLAVSFGIAARHNAKINVETGPRGTTFYVHFAIK
ncbi:MAG: PAS domain S-box protein [Carboxydocellales bacterium]